MLRQLSPRGRRTFDLSGFSALLVLVAISGSLQVHSVTFAQDAPSAEEVLHKLRSNDDLYSSGVTARGIELEQSPNLPIDLGVAAAQPAGKRERKAKLAFTLADDREASIEENLTQFPGTGVPGPNGSSTGPVHKTVFIVSGDSTTTRRFISPKGPADHQSSTSITLLSGQRNVWFEVRILWSLGRGFAPFLDEVTSVAVEKGSIQLEATGILVNPTDRGAWSLTIDPKLDYAVTRARYTEATRPKFEMDASDFATNGNCVYPKSSKTNYANLMKHEHEYTAVRLGFDEDLFAEAVKLATEAPSKGSVIHDNRVLRPMPGVRLNAASVAGRPTAETVAAAVQVSRDRFNERYDAQTLLTAASARSDDLRIRIDRAETATAALKFEQLLLQQRIRAAEKRRLHPLPSAPEVEDEKPLMPFDWHQPYIGAVGFIGPQAQENETSGAVRCLQRIDENRFIGQYESSTSAPATGKRNFTSRPFLFVGVHRDENGKPIDPGGLYRVKFNGIVTGAFTYAEPGKGDRDIGVIERFESDAPFQ